MLSQMAFVFIHERLKKNFLIKLFTEGDVANDSSNKNGFYEILKRPHFPVNI